MLVRNRLIPLRPTQTDVSGYWKFNGNGIFPDQQLNEAVSISIGMEKTVALLSELLNPLNKEKQKEKEVLNIA